MVWQDEGSADKHTVGGIGSLCPVSLASSYKVKYSNKQRWKSYATTETKTATILAKAQQNLPALLWQFYTEQVGQSQENQTVHNRISACIFAIEDFIVKREKIAGK